MRTERQSQTLSVWSISAQLRCVTCDAQDQTREFEEKGKLGYKRAKQSILIHGSRHRKCKSNSSKQKGLGSVVWCGEVVWRVRVVEMR
jgi:hypothetical protein